MGVKCFMVELRDDGTWSRPDAGDEYFSFAQVPPGAMWFADWMVTGEGPQPFAGPDGRCLVVKLPNGNEWMIDAVCSNCPDREDALSGGHKCWVRHGEAPNITVDKKGRTCSAGAGSIQSGNYHGFLRNGEFT